MYKQLNYTLFYTFITRINPPNINFNKSPKIRTYKHLINRVFNYQITYLSATFSTKSAIYADILLKTSTKPMIVYTNNTKIPPQKISLTRAKLARITRLFFNGITILRIPLTLKIGHTIHGI